jgi:hypothetical protein
MLPYIKVEKDLPENQDRKKLQDYFAFDLQAFLDIVDLDLM